MKQTILNKALQYGVEKSNIYLVDWIFEQGTPENIDECLTLAIKEKKEDNFIYNLLNQMLKESLEENTKEEEENIKEEGEIDEEMMQKYKRKILKSICLYSNFFYNLKTGICWDLHGSLKNQGLNLGRKGINILPSGISDNYDWVNDYILNLMSGMKEKASFLQKVVGYWMTGDVGTKEIFILYGNGGNNGKSQFLGAISKILGDYASILGNDSFNINDAYGKRLLMKDGCYEEDDFLGLPFGSDEGFYYKELYGQYKTFKKEFKYVFQTNKLPKYKHPLLLHRMIVIPFDRIFNDKNKDINIARKLEQHRSELIAWMLEGAKRYYKEGITREEYINFNLEQKR